MIARPLCSVAPTDPTDRAGYIQELKRAYRAGELRPQRMDAPTDDRMVRVILPHLYPPVVAEA